MRMLEEYQNLPLSADNSNIKILYADDDRLQRMTMRQILSETDFTVFEAANGVEVIDLFHREQPDLLILDIIMPEMDGTEAARQIQKEIDDHYIPIIFITGSQNDTNLQRCIDVGGDEFIQKPLNPIMLRAKINSLLRVKQLYQRQYQQKNALLAYQQQLDREQKIAHALSERMIQSNFLDTPNLRQLLSPMALFNGDVLLSTVTPGGNHCLFLGDFTGHGLSASIGAGPTAEIFYGMARKGFGIREILSEINAKLHKMLPVDMFLAACIVIFDVESRTINISTGGLPDHYLNVKTSGEFVTIKSMNLPLGIVENGHFHPEIQYFEVDANDRLILFTDGLVEAENEKGEPFGFEGVEKSFKYPLKESDSYCKILKNQLDVHYNGSDQQDDVTIVELICDFTVMSDQKNKRVKKNVVVHPSKWRTTMEFDAATLRKFNPVPTIIHNLIEIQNLQDFREPLFLIVTELFCNALDHGLLLLDSKMKETSDGLIDYFEKREQRLAGLTEGFIKISCNHEPIDRGGRLVIRVQDSGPGFRHDDAVSGLDNNETVYGRGIALVKKLCHSLDYSGNGNRVKAVFEWNCDF